MLVIIGGLNYAMDASIELLAGLLIAVVTIFILICMGGASQANQLLSAKLFTMFFAFIMCVVIIGVASEIATEFHSVGSGTNTTNTTLTSPAFHELGAAIIGKGAGIVPNTAISVSTIYLGAIIAMFLIAGLMHINEAIALVHGLCFYIPIIPL